jgi:glutamate-ammonia-ligase adenylyltransferase
MCEPDFQDGARARRLLLSFLRECDPGERSDLEERLRCELAACADADMALLNLERWAAHLATPRGTLRTLAEAPRLLRDLTHLLGGSQYLADVLVREPHLYGMLLQEDSARTAEEFRRAVEAALRPLRRPESRRDALRRVKRRELLRIGWRDLARGAPLEELVREISSLADSLIAAAVQLAREELAERFPSAAAAVSFAAIALGKLGARELNYSSDVDLVFVMDSPSPAEEAHRRYATRLAETVIAILAEDTAEGRCFRVDMRLRPEGRAGALVRSFRAFRDYYDRWAETWERQALIKARFVAGDEELGARFVELTRPVAYRRLQGATLLEDIRENRAAVERKLAAEGTFNQHVKEGRGTIREVEFTVQVLQLLFGAENPRLQAPDTLGALAALAECGLLTPGEQECFTAGYRFFRTVEHRLQLLHDLPVRTLPTEPRELRRLARTLGYATADEFMEAYRTLSAAVHSVAAEIRGRLGVSTGSGEDGLRLAVLSADTPEGEAALRGELEQRGITPVGEAITALQLLAAGSAHHRHPAGTRRLFADVVRPLLDSCAAAPDPVRALSGVADLAERKLLHRALYQTWGEHPAALGALCRFAGAAPVAMRQVLRYPELSDLVTDAEQLAVVPDTAGHTAQLQERLGPAPPHPRALAVLRRFRHREFVRSAARQVLQPLPPSQEVAAWSDVAEALLQAALEVAARRLPEEPRALAEEAPWGQFAVLALGRFGGRELHLASDLDLMYIHGPAGSPARYEALAKAFGEAVQEITEDGRLFELDLRLRPEGRQGPLVASLDAARRYYAAGGRAETWEYQMLTRLRPVAGCGQTAAAFVTLVAGQVFRSPMPAGWRAEIRAMKRRIETERVTEQARGAHLKLGPGGFSDLEFLVQLLQLEHGARYPAVRAAGTRSALLALAEAGVLPTEETEALLGALDLLTRIRQAQSLLREDGSPDLLPVAPGEEQQATALARALGYPAFATLLEDLRARTAVVRERCLQVLG